MAGMMQDMISNLTGGTPPPMPPTGQNPVPPPPQTAMNPGQPPTSQFGNNPMQVPPPMPMPPGGGGNFNPIGIREDNFYGGQKIAGADPSQADYGSVQGYADQAYDQARRRIDPMQEQQGRRMEQDLINKGIDPSSAQGRAMLDQQNRDFTDQNNAATFGALQFGQGIQNQMSQQEQAQAELAGNMQQGFWGQETARKGQELGFELGQMGNETARAGQDVQRYGMDLRNQLGMGNLDLAQNQAEHGQGMDWMNYDLNVYNTNQQNQMIQDALYNQQYGATPIPGMTPVNATSPANTYLGAGNTKYVEGEAGISI